MWPAILIGGVLLAATVRRMIRYPYPAPSWPIGRGARSNRTDYTRPMGERWPAFMRGDLRSFTSLIDWLDVERSTRWLRDGDRTYCDHYFLDFFDQWYGANVVPNPAGRWWTSTAIEQLRAGAKFPATRENTRERNATGLNEWLRTDGPAFGWRHLPSAAALREYVTQTGLPGAISTAGHVAVVLPDAVSPTSDPNAPPLQSQAGGTNYRLRRAASWYAREPSALFVVWDNRA